MSSLKRVIGAIVVSILLMTSLASEASATSYQDTPYIFLTGDETGPHWADFRLEYTFPDKVNPNQQFYVDISLTYVKNEYAKLAWVEVFNTRAYVRKLDTKLAQTVSGADPSRRRIAPGERYTSRLTLNAPSDPGDYLLAMTWTTYNLETSAYGKKMNAGNIAFDSGDWQYIGNARFAVQRLTASTSTTTSSLRVTTASPSPLPSPDLSMVGVILALIIAAIIFFLLLRRKRTTSDATHVSGVPPPFPPPVYAPPPPPPPPPEETSYCINCGASIPQQAKFCRKCGATQR